MTGITECQFNLQNDSDFVGLAPPVATACRQPATQLCEHDDEWYCPRHAVMMSSEYEDAASEGDVPKESGAIGTKQL